ncbi:hypothetical protein [Rhizobium sp. No.120]
MNREERGRKTGRRPLSHMGPRIRNETFPHLCNIGAGITPVLGVEFESLQ